MVSRKEMFNQVSLIQLVLSNGYLSLELGHPECYTSFGQLVEAVAQQIYYHNHQRIHTALKCPPAVFRERYFQDQQIKKVSKMSQILNFLKTVLKIEKMTKINNNHLTFQDITKTQ